MEPYEIISELSDKLLHIDSVHVHEILMMIFLTSK